MKWKLGLYGGYLSSILLRERERARAILAQVSDPASSPESRLSGTGPFPSWGTSPGGRGVDVCQDGERLEQHTAAICQTSRGTACPPTAERQSLKGSKFVDVIRDWLLP